MDNYIKKTGEIWDPFPKQISPPLICLVHIVLETALKIRILFEQNILQHYTKGKPSN